MQRLLTINIHNPWPINLIPLHEKARAQERIGFMFKLLLLKTLLAKAVDCVELVDPAKRVRQGWRVQRVIGCVNTRILRRKRAIIIWFILDQVGLWETKEWAKFLWLQKKKKDFWLKIIRLMGELRVVYIMQWFGWKIVGFCLKSHTTPRVHMIWIWEIFRRSSKNRSVLILETLDWVLFLVQSVVSDRPGKASSVLWLGITTCTNSWLSVKYYSSLTGLGIIRVSRDKYTIVWAALTFITEIKNENCLIRVVHLGGKGYHDLNVLLLSCRDLHALHFIRDHKKMPTGGNWIWSTTNTCT